jgi:Tol biopolymer transport system component
MITHRRDPTESLSTHNHNRLKEVQMNTRLYHPGLALAFLGLFAGCGTDAEIVDPGVTQADVQGSVSASRFSEWSEAVNLGPTVNSPYNELVPEMSKDGLSLYFSSTRPGGQGRTDIWVSRRASADDAWGTPVNLGSVINTAYTEGVTHLSRDGHRLFFVSNRPGGPGSNDYWVSWRDHTHDDFGWEEPVHLGPVVNSPSWEGGASLRRPEFYFVSDRPGGLGYDDIYVSRMRGDGTFGPPALVTELSSTGDELRPSIRFDGLEIFFQSYRIGSSSYDIWVSTRKSVADAWSPPVMLGPAINGPYHDRQPGISEDGTLLFFASDRPGGSGGRDLYVATRVVDPQ